MVKTDTPGRYDAAELSMAESTSCIIRRTMVCQEPWKGIECGQTGNTDPARPLCWLDNAVELVAVD